MEDSLIVYRVSRAPERRIFYVDVCSLPSGKAEQYLKNVMNKFSTKITYDVNTGAISNRKNYQSIMEDYWLPRRDGGKGTEVSTLPGGQNLSEIDDLKYFNNKMARGLRVPSSYLPTGPEENESTFQDGKMGTALIQEFRFNQYCERLQSQVITNLDKEFKLFLAFRGFNIDSSIFDLTFNAPQNFASYRQSELDTSKISNYSSVSEIPHMSKRFALKRYLGLSEEEMLENETLWREENGEDGTVDAEGADMRGVGVGPGDFDADLGSMDDFDAEMDDMGGEEGEAGVDTGPGEITTPEV